MMAPTPKQIYVYRDRVDFRKSIDGLCALVQDELGYDPFDDHWFVFTNKRRNRIKILHWNRNGFGLWLKRLEKDRFIWPKADDSVIELSCQQLQWLLDGYNLNVMKPHPTRHYQYA